MADDLIIVAFGGGVDSTAMLIGMRDKGVIPDLILFADTGGERPETYRHIDVFSNWLELNLMPRIVIVKKVRRNGEVLTLENDCLEKGMLPSIAYGFKSCSLKYKVSPQDKYCNNYPPAISHWASGKKVIKYIGYDANEERRAKIMSDQKYEYRYPLIDWGWDRDSCLEALHKEGFDNVGKSACFFCPSSKKREILAMQESHPLLLLRAIDIENNAMKNLTSVKGLGRNFNWSDFINGNDTARNSVESYIDTPCGCYDGYEDLI